MVEDLDVLRRRWSETKSSMDEQNYLAALVARGYLEERRLKMAAALGYPAAIGLCAEVPDLPSHYRSKIRAAVAALSPVQGVAFALECAKRAYARWELVKGDDSRPLEAIRITECWLNGQAVPETELRHRGTAASDASAEMRNPDRGIDSQQEAASNAADAASSVALAAENAQHFAALGEPVDPNGIEQCASYAARFAVLASTHQSAEEQWQIKRLIAYLLGQAD